MVMSPELRRPPVRLRMTTSGLYGFSAVMSSFTSVVWNRSVGVIGLYVLIGIFKLLASSCRPPISGDSSSFFLLTTQIFDGPRTSEKPEAPSWRPFLTGCQCTLAFSRRPGGEHMPSSSPDDIRQTAHDGAPCPDSWP